MSKPASFQKKVKRVGHVSYNSSMLYSTSDSNSISGSCIPSEFLHKFMHQFVVAFKGW